MLSDMIKDKRTTTDLGVVERKESHGSSAFQGKRQVKVLSPRVNAVINNIETEFNSKLPEKLEKQKSSKFIICNSMIIRIHCKSL